MNERRIFLKTAATASVVAFAATPLAFAAGNTDYTNIIYTTDNPGKWKGKAAIHVPQVTVTGTKVDLVTTHPMSEAHFIVRHTLILEDGTYLGAATFTAEDKPESSYELPAGYNGKIYATSFCNLHDFWLTETMV